jgi:hypothetical protein
MSRSRVSEWLLSLLLVALAVTLWVSMRPAQVPAVVLLEISRNAVPINTLDQPREIDSRQQLWIDRFDLASNGQLRHPQLGQIGYGEQFFIDAELRLRMRRAASLRFEVQSDDGFALEIDDRRVCAFVGHRALAGQSCRVLLEEGEHRLRLSYFQAGGPAGLLVRYGEGGEGPLTWLGEDTDYLEVLR